MIVWPLNAQQAGLRALIGEYNARATIHLELERKYARLAKFSDSDRAITRRNGKLICIAVAQRPEVMPKYLELVSYHRALKEKYKRAALQPRLPTEPE